MRVKSIGGRLRGFGMIPSPSFGDIRKTSLSMVVPIGGSGVGKKVLLYKYREAVTGGRWVPRDQADGSDCVGHSTARAIDTLTGVQIAGLGLPEKLIGTACASAVYGGSRHEIGWLVHKSRFRGAGSVVQFAAEFIKQYGCIYELEYPEYDLRVHTWSRSKEWGSKGVPDILEPIAREHPIGDYLPVKSWPEYRDAIANGWPVIIGSNQGFDGVRGRRPVREAGFLKPRGNWAHAMVGTGVDDLSSRKGGLIENSWGEDWVEGEELFDQPLGSFWADADVIDHMCSSGDAIAISRHQGFPIGPAIRDYTLL